MKNLLKPNERSELLKRRMAGHILVLDGAMGTAIQDKNLTAADFGGAELEGCNENLVLTRPEVIADIYRDYLKAGADILETNTFGSTPLVLDEYGLSQKCYELNLVATQIARKVADEASTPDKPRFVAGSIGPTTKAISVTGGITFEGLIDNFYAQSKGLVDGGADYFLIETCQDTRNIKAAILGIQKLLQERKLDIPIAISATIEPMGTMLAGQSVEALLASVSHYPLLYLGLNCATGPEFMTDHIRTLAKQSRFPVSCVPNAGLPDENGKYLETPDMLASVVNRFLENKWVNVIGGCCGTTAAHIAALAKIAKSIPPRRPEASNRSVVSGIEFLEITDDIRPVIVGERTNVIGSKKFKTLICEEKFDEASDIAKAQIKAGAQILDVCLANPDRDEATDVKKFLELAIKKVKAPLMIDSTDEKVIALALTYSQGKAIINSINLEDGEERFEKVVPMAVQFGAALVVGTIDDDPKQGMGITRERKLEIAKREYQLLTEKYGVAPEDIYWDPLVFPCATGDEQYIGSAVETIEGIRLLKQHFPRTRTVLGISNVSFGLPNAGREVLNSVFLYHCVQAGLDLAIVNSQKLERYASISNEEKKLSDDLLWNRGADPIAAFAAHFRTKKVVKKDKKDLPLEERLPRYIIEGSKDGLTADLDEALKTKKPLEIINGPLMKGMDEVGRLFNTNQLIVAEVLQSAEAMKAAVSHLEPFMEKSDSSSRGTMLLATVKGDVHDIGKNLVDIILSNNGFKVVNLGIKIPPEQLIAAIKEHKPDLIGLSGLLVKSAQQMVITAADLTRTGCTLPMLVGGAALSENFVDKQISVAYGGTVAYAQDAMSGLDLAKKIMDPNDFETLKTGLKERRDRKKAEATEVAAPIASPAIRSTDVSILSEVPKPTFGTHVLRNTPIDHIWRFINPMMLYSRHLGLKGPIVRDMEKVELHQMPVREIEAKDPKAASIFRAVQELKQEFRGKPELDPSAVYGFFPAGSHGNRLFIGSGTNGGARVRSFEFPRQAKPNGLCLADYVLPVSSDSPKFEDLKDSVGLFVTSIGKGLRETAEAYKNRGEYLKSHIIQILALESAEAYAELLHSQMRMILGFPDGTEITMLQRFQAKYHGKRYSFGYPACPRLDDQTLLFDLLNPKQIGVELTEGFMMEPEASVSALVFHHPQAAYFSVGNAQIEGEEAFPRAVMT